MINSKLIFEGNRADIQVYLYYRKHDVLIRTNKISYNDQNGIAGCLLMFLMLRHYKTLSTKRIDNYVKGLEEKGIDCASGWAGAVKPGFSPIVKSQKVPSSVTSTKKTKSRHEDLDINDLQKEIAAKRLHFVDES